MVEVVLPLLLTLGYLVLLAGVAKSAEESAPLARLARHPIAYGLALGVYATSWTFYGGVGLAHHSGWAFLAISLGVTLSCIAIPFLWEPLARILQRHQLTSVADLFAFRFQSQLAGVLVTLFMVAALLPYLSLQLRAIADAADFVGEGLTPPWMGVVYAAALSMFAGLLGARYADPDRAGRGLLATLAIESIVKLACMAVVGVAALQGVFGGLAGLEAHLAETPEALERLRAPVRDGEAPFNALLMLAFVAAFLLPRQFHVAFAAKPEVRDPRGERHLRTAAWVLPLFLLLLNLPLPVLFFAGEMLAESGTPPDRFVLVAAPSAPIRLVAFLGGVSASSAMILASSLALGGMVVNHLVVPLRGTRGLSRPYVHRLRQGVIVLLVAAGFAFHLVAPRHGTLVDLGLVSFAAVLQLFPGVLATLFWPRATREGIIGGLVCGGAVWLTITALPLLGWASPSEAPRALGLDVDPRGAAVWRSLLANAVALALGTLLATPRAIEVAAAASCAIVLGTAAHNAPPALKVLERRIAAALGPSGAASELAATRAHLGMRRGERSPLAVLRLADELERRLSALLGPLSARRIVRGDDAPEAVSLVAAELRFLRDRGRQDRSVPSETLEASLERVRRYLSGVLDELPLGVCAVDGSGAIAVWNQELEELTGIDAEAVLGLPLVRIGAPWAEVLAGELRGAPGGVAVRVVEGGEHEHIRETVLPTARGERVLRFRRGVLLEGASPSDSLAGQSGALVVIEDLTERRALRRQVEHNDRLASLGRMAAGVAHELGNPLAGLLMVAKNLAREPQADDAAERLELIVDEGLRIEATLRELLAFARKEGKRDSLEMERAPVRLDDVCQDAVRLSGLGGRGPEVTFTLEALEEAEVLGSRRQLTQVLVNLLSNARHASSHGDVVDVRVEARGREGVGGWCIAVVDQGPGVPESIAERIFEPFVTTKPVGEGTGLGLAVSQRIARAHGGALDFERRGPSGGAVFRLWLPPRPASSERTRDTDRSVGGREPRPESVA